MDREQKIRNSKFYEVLDRLPPEADRRTINNEVLDKLPPEADRRTINNEVLDKLKQ